MEETWGLAEGFLEQLSQLSRQMDGLDEVGEGPLRMRLEDEVSRQASAVMETFSHAADAMFLLDATSPPKVVDCNEAALSVFGYDAQELVGQSIGLLHVSESSFKEFWVLAQAALGDSHGWYCLAEYRMRRKDGSVFAADHAIAQLLDERGERTGWVDEVRDAASRCDRAERPTTPGGQAGVLGLPDRVFVRGEGSVLIADAGRRGVSIAVMMLGLDMETASGEDVGRGLQRLVTTYVVRRLKRAMRKGDTFVQTGRDEVAVLLAGLPQIQKKESVGRIARRMLRALSVADSLESKGVSFRTSIGIAVYPDDCEDFEGVVRRAHAAMNCARRQGGARYEHYGLSSIALGDLVNETALTGDRRC